MTSLENIYQDLNIGLTKPLTWMAQKALRIFKPDVV